jgi:hypothetical protein
LTPWRKIPGWLTLELWTAEHWQPLRAQRLELLASNAAFWSTIGSFALPLIMLGAVVIWLDKRQLPVPAFLGWSLLAWIVVASLIIEVSGFPLGMLLPGANFGDTYSLAVNGLELDAIAASQQVFGQAPGWIKWLLTLRNLIVKPFGLTSGRERTAQASLRGDNQGETQRRRQ